MQKRGKQSRNNSVALGQSLVPLQGIYIAVFLRCFAGTETPTNWKKLTKVPTAHRPQTGWNQKVNDADSQLPHHQPVRRMSLS